MDSSHFLRFGAKNEMNPKKSPQRRGNEVTNVE
jgi:hypothetical protein